MQPDARASLLVALVGDREQISQPDLSRSLYEISIRLPNSALRSLYQSDLGSAISEAAQDQVWWFRRTEYLIRREFNRDFSLSWRVGDWRFVYKSLDNCGFRFLSGCKCTRLLAEVLLELGADPSIKHNEVISESVRYGSADLVELLLQDDRVIQKLSVGRNGDRLLTLAVERGHVKIVLSMLKYPRVIRPYNAIIAACRLGSYHILTILVESTDSYTDPEDIETTNEFIRDGIRLAHNRGHNKIEEYLVEKLAQRL